jgi:hypothetical protein
LSPSKVGWLIPTEPLTMRSEVIGDFQEPYGAIFGEFDKLSPLLLPFLLDIYLLSCRETLENF